MDTRRAYVLCITVLVTAITSARAETIAIVDYSLDAASPSGPEYKYADGSPGRDYINQMLAGELVETLHFSVDRLSTGQVSSVVASSYAAQTSACDIFGYNLAGGSPGVSVIIPSTTLGLVPGFFGDDLDALSARQFGVGGPPGELEIRANYEFAYNTRWRDSVDIGQPARYPYNGAFDPDGITPDDILIGGMGALFASGVVDLGLQPGDAIDGLILMDLTPDPLAPLGYRNESNGRLDPGIDKALISLDAFSPSTIFGGGVWSPADVLLFDFINAPQVFLSAAQLGLNPTDNVDALSIIPEPAAGAFLLAGGISLGWRKRRRPSPGIRRAPERAHLLALLAVLTVGSTSQAQLLNPVPGDSDGDYDVDLRDLARFQVQLASPGAVPPAVFDMDVDHDTDLADYRLLGGAVGGPRGGCAAGTVVHMCGISPPIGGSKALLELRYDEGNGQVCLALDATDPDGVVLPLQPAQSASILASSPPRIVFTHIVNHDGGQLRIHGDVILGEIGKCVLDLKPLNATQAVRYLLNDMSLVGVVYSGPTPGEIAGCTGESKQFAFSFVPRDPNEPIYGTWQIVDGSGVPVDTNGLAGTTGFYAFDPAEGEFDFDSSGAQVSETVSVFARQFHPPAQPKTYYIKVTAATRSLDCPIPPTLSGPLSFRTLSVACAFGNEFFELGKTRSVPLTVTNPCNVRLSGKYVVDSNAFYEAPSNGLNIAPGATATLAVPLRNLQGHGPPQTVAVTVQPDQAGGAHPSGVMTFEPPVVLKVFSKYTSKSVDGTGDKSAVFIQSDTCLNIGPPDCDPDTDTLCVGRCPERFHATIDWRSHAPGSVEFRTSGGPNAVSTLTNTATKYLRMTSQGLNPIGKVIQVSAVSSDGSRSMVALPANCGVVANPIVDAFQRPQYDGTSPKDLKYKYTKFNLDGLKPPTIEGSSFKEKAPGQGGQEWKWKPLVEVVPAANGSARSASVTVAAGASASKDTGDVVFKAETLGKTKGPKTMGLEFEAKASYEYLWTIPPSSTVWTDDGGKLGISGKMGLAIPPKPAQFVFVVFAIPIPCYWQGKASYTLVASFTQRNLADPNQVQRSAEITLTPAGELVLGVGWASVKIGVEAAVGGGDNIGMVFTLSGNPPPGNSIGPINKFDIFFTGEIRANLWIYSFSLASTACNLYLLPNAALACPLLPGGRGETWEPMSRDYAQQLDFARFHGALPQRGGGVTTETTIVNNEFPQADPDISASGGDPLLVWLTDDLARPELDRTKAQFSRKSAGTWSPPVAIEDDGTADFDPQLAGIGAGDAVAVWVDANQSIPSGASVTDFPQYLHISAAVYDGGAGVWGPATSLSADNHLEFVPRVAGADNGTALAVWVSNANNELFGSAAAPNTIMAARFNGSSWSAAHVVASNVGALLDINVAYDGAEAVVMFTGDPDDDLGTPDDFEIYAVTHDGSAWSNVTRITSDAVRDVNPKPAYDENGDLLFVWNRDGDLVSATQFDLDDLTTIVDRPGPKGGLVDFDVAVDTSGLIGVVWPEESDELLDAFYAVYDADHDRWSQTRRLTANRDNEKNLSAVFAGDGKIYVAARDVRMELQSQIVDVNGEDVLVDVPMPTQTDLVVAEHSVFTDLAVDTLGFTLVPELPQAGDVATIGVVILNVGDRAAGNIDVAVYDGDPDLGGVQIGATQTIAGPLAGGDSATLGFAWTVPASSTPREIFAVVDPAQAQSDFDFANNKASIFMLVPDLDLDTFLVSNPDMCSREIVYRVINYGPTDTDAGEIAFHNGAVNGDLIGTIGVPALLAGEASSNAFTIPDPAFDGAGEAVVYAVLNEDNGVLDFDPNNNVRVAAITMLATDSSDCNTNGFTDECDLQLGLSTDCNTNGVPDECDPDCNANATPDDCDILAGSSADVNTDALPDECEDCNSNSVVDEYDLAGGTSADCNSNAVPDECEPDCNVNGVADECDIAALTSMDCDANQVPDECAPDCNANGRADACDVTIFLSSADCDSNGVPDECQADCDSNGIIDGCEIAAGSADDCDSNAVPDVCDPDADGDGLVNACDNCPGVSNPTQDNRDGDGQGDACDADADADGAQGPVGDNSDCDDLEPLASPLFHESLPLDNCADGIDNDCDGFTDAADPHC